MLLAASRSLGFRRKAANLERRLKYIEAILESGRFDALAYRRSAAGFFARAIPVHDYVGRGESRNCEPFPGFRPLGYTAINEDVGEAGVPPLYHYLRDGISEQRRCGHLPLGLREMDFGELGRSCAWKPLSKDKRLAVVLHVYHGDLWPALRERLDRIPEAFDLYATVVKRPVNAGLTEVIAKAFPESRVVEMPNHGRDVFPFVWFASGGFLDGYDAVLKIHTKRSRHIEEGDAWRNHLWDDLLPDREGVERLLAALRSNQRAGLVTASGQVVSGMEWWDVNRYRLEALVQRAGMGFQPEALSFPAGSMFWAKPAALRSLKRLGLSAFDFETEAGQTDGTTAHLVERAVGWMSLQSGFEVLDTEGLLGETRGGESGKRFFSPTDDREFADGVQPPRSARRRLRGSGAAGLEGYEIVIDECSVRGVIGWAINHDRPDQRLTVSCRVDGDLLERRMADEFRTDLAEAGLSDGRYGFFLRIPEPCFDGGRHGFEVAVGRGEDEAARVSVVHRLPSRREIGAVWQCGGRIEGWVCNPFDRERVPWLELMVGGYTVDVQHPDAEDSIFDFTRRSGMGRVPFCWDAGKHLSERELEKAVVRLGGSRCALPWCSEVVGLAGIPLGANAAIRSRSAVAR